MPAKSEYLFSFKLHNADFKENKMAAIRIWQKKFFDALLRTGAYAPDFLNVQVYSRYFYLENDI